MGQVSVRSAHAAPTGFGALLAWTRKHLFSSPLNTFITLATGALIYAVARPVLTWAFNEARWDVVPRTARLLAIGPFPPQEAWRVWLSLGLVLACVAVTIVAARTRPASILRRAGPFLWVAAVGISTALLLKVPMNLWGGMFLTIVLTVTSLAIAFPLSVALALGRTSSLPIVRILSTAFVELMRGVPLVSVLFLAWLMVPLFVPENWRSPQVVRAIIGFALFNAAYYSEYVRGGLQGVSKGQHEGAWSLGLSSFDTMMRIVLPQAIRSVIPGLVGQSITAFKNTSLVVIIGLLDLLGITQSILANPNFLGLERELYLFLMLIYFLLSSLMSYGGRRLEARMGLGRR